MAMWRDFGKFEEATSFAAELKVRATIRFNPTTGRYDVEWYRD